MNSKGSNVIFTSIMIMLLSVVAMVIIIGFVTPYISSLKDELQFKQNKENLFLINKEFIDLKNYDINTYKNLNINTRSEIIFDNITNTVEIKQKISNDSFNNFRDLNYGNIFITKRNNQLIYTLYLDGITTLEKSFIVNNRTQVKMEVLDIVDGIPTISLSSYLGLAFVNLRPRFGSFLESVEVTMVANPEDANIYYTLDGNEPTEDSTLYAEPITITNNTTIKARAYANGYLPSTIIIGKYTKTLLSFISFTVDKEDQNFETNLIVTVSSDPAGNIYYTTNGETPTEESTPYVGDINVTSTTTYKFRAFKTNYNPSEVITRTYTKILELLYLSTPTADPVAGSYTSSQNVTLSSEENGTIYYTTDGNIPTIGSTEYSSPINIPLDTNMTIKAFAVKEGYQDSNIFSGDYFITHTGYRLEILFDHTKVDANLTNFPALINIKSENLLNAKSDGTDIYFTEADGTTRLKREIESLEDINAYKRKKITIDYTKVQETLTNFPMLISITDANLATYAKEDGADIYFTEADGTTRLKREIEYYNPATGNLIAWVNIPTLSSLVNTEIYMYFGDENENNSNNTDTWNNYLAVWHMNNNGTTTISDSTSNSNNGTKKGITEPANNSSGKILNAQTFDGNDDYISNAGTTIPLQGTISLWANFNNVAAIQYFIGGTNTGSTQGIRYNGSNFLAYNGGTGYTTVNWTKQNAFVYFTAVRIATNDYNLYINGEYIGVSNAGNNNKDIIITLLGKRPDNLYIFNGPIDEFRVSNTRRSVGWIKTEYNNQNSPSTFYSVGEMEEITNPTRALYAWVKIPLLSSTEDTKIYMYFGDDNENNSNDTDVWDSNYLMVHHFNNNYLDSTANGFTLTATGSPAFTKDSNGDYYLRLDGATQYLSAGTSSLLSPLTTGQFTVDTIFLAKSGIINYARIFYKKNNFFLASNIGNTGYSFGSDFGSGSTARTHTNTLTYDAFNNYSFVFPNKTNIDNSFTYFNSNLASNIATSGWILTAGDDNFTIGANSTPANYAKIDIKEFRVSNIARSPSWLITQHNNWSSPSTFYSVGSLEVV